jgi:hypothetical protein
MLTRLHFFNRLMFFQFILILALLFRFIIFRFEFLTELLDISLIFSRFDILFMMTRIDMNFIASVLILANSTIFINRIFTARFRLKLNKL